MSDVFPSLALLADKFGIAQEFWDWKGRHVAIPADTIIAVLHAFDIDAATPEAADDALTRLEDERWLRTLPPCTVVEEGAGCHVTLHVPAGFPVRVHIRLESGQTRPAWQVDNHTPDRWVGGYPRGEATFWLGADLPLGYHHIVAETDGRVEEAALIVTPRFVGFPAAMRGERIWGYGTQLYSVTSRDSWGIGDLADLADLITWSGTEQSAGYVLINPLHAAQPVEPMEPSPYLPASRRFINPIYIRPEAIAEYATLKRDDRRAVRDLRRAAQAATTSDSVDRNAIWPLKLEALRIVHRAGLRPARRIAFDDFRRREGIALRSFALWSQLCLVHGPEWPDWPSELQRPGSPEVAAFAEEHAEGVEFFEWLQWIAQTQVSAAQAVAADVGMPVGVVTDLAVGVNRTGAETWMMPEVFAASMSVGAPPDQYNQAGQDWGQPPWRPDKLAELAYAPFRAMVAASLRRAGGLRVDHIIGMFRLWWVPTGAGGPTRGTYVRNDHEAMIGILALEAHRAQALVIGEDLGTVEPWVRHYLARRGILGTSVLWFEGDDAGQPLSAERWREYCMASVTTHDLPPTLGYLAGDHVRLRDELGLLTEPLAEELEAARREQAAWLGKLIDESLLAEADAGDPVEVLLALHKFLLRTPSKVLLANLTDAVGERRTQNQPGTIDEYPNWRVPLGDRSGRRIGLEEIFTASLPKRLAAVLNGREAPPEPSRG